MKNLLFLLILFSPLFSPAQVIVTAVGGGSSLGDGGPALDAKLEQPWGINIDDSGNLYICDAGTNRVRKVTSGYGGIINTIAGNGTEGYSGDGGLGINAQLFSPFDVAVDKHGNVFIADQGNNCIRKVTPLDTITTIAGTGAAGYNGDNILATTAQLNAPEGVAIDSIGNVYIVDEFNYRIRKVDTAGIITTIAGTGTAGYSPDACLADTAQLNHLYGIRISKTGNIFFADNARIRRIDSGLIYTVAGDGTLGYSGDSGLATAAEIGGGAIAIDSSGNLYIADEDANRVREVNVAEGIIYTIAGNGIQGFSGDDGPPLLAELSNVGGVAGNNATDMYIADNANYRIRLITTHPLGTSNIAGQKQEISVFPNPSDGMFTFIISSNTNEQTKVIVTNILGEKVREFSAKTNEQNKIELNVPPGIYLLLATTTQKEFNEKIVIE